MYFIRSHFFVWVLYIAAIFYSSYSFAQSGRVGIGTTSPLARFHVADSAVLFTGPYPLPSTITTPPPVSGPGTRFMWYPAKAALRAGTVEDDSWDMNNIGNYSFAFGLSSKASSEQSYAFGRLAKAMSYGSISIGEQSSAGDKIGRAHV